MTKAKGVRLDRRTPILQPYQEWFCTACGMDTQVAGLVSNRFHHCKAKGLTWPLQLRGVRSHIVTHERGDYVGKELVQLDKAMRPVMAVHTVRDDGHDTAVYAPSARAGAD